MSGETNVADEILYLKGQKSEAFYSEEKHSSQVTPWTAV